MLQRTFACMCDERVIVNVMNALQEIGELGPDAITKLLIADQGNLSNRDDAYSKRIIWRWETARRISEAVVEKSHNIIGRWTHRDTWPQDRILFIETILKRLEFHMSLVITFPLPRLSRILSHEHCGWWREDYKTVIPVMFARIHGKSEDIGDLEKLILVNPLFALWPNMTYFSLTEV